jgi:mono/diheme cytochrome c family protein
MPEGRAVRVGAAGVALLALFAGGARAKEWPTKVPSEAERGRELYERHCLVCHGASGAGDGPLGLVVGGVPNYKDGYGGRDTEELVTAVQRGKGKMPAFDAAFDKKDAEKVVKYLGALGHNPPPEKKAPAPAEDAGEAENGG